MKQNLKWAALGLIAATTFAACASSTKTAAPTSVNGTPSTPLSPNSTPVETGDSHSGVQPKPLSHEDAQTRSHQIGHVTYELWFGLDASHLDYEGRAVISFDLRPKAKDHGKTLFLDFTGGNLKALTLNGVAAKVSDLTDPAHYDGNRIYFKISDLQPGTNRVEIAYSHEYSRFGNGFYRFVDPEDKQVYLYSNFEPYRAHLMFPCFDQPDLKASYELTVETPENWEVVSNTLERDVTKVDGRKSWQFPPSPIFSTYVFALHAGPYTSWKGNADGIPMRLFARKSVAKYVDSKEWLDVTKDGLSYYSTEFGYPYPYSKYDQLLVPDFNAGAMENVAAVTFSERAIFRSHESEDAHRRRAETILHEMAHMWFGDLVTMKWWNGLWLNESFATFMSAGAVEKSTHFPGSWQAFFSGEKQWAYWNDQLVVTHPIEVPIVDTDAAESSFDGITYGKGASVLKQLKFYLGEDDFKEGIQRYFERFALRNTTIADFFKMLTEASNKDLGKWQELWLQTPGVNTIRADWSCEDGRVAKFSLAQGAPAEYPKLRPHKTEIAFFSRAGGKLTVKEKFEVSYSAAETPVADAIGKPCPAFVFPNYEDYDYVKVELDPTSLGVISKELANIGDALTRQMLWHTIWEMVVDGKLKSQEYAEIAINQAAKERDPLVLAKILNTLASKSANGESVFKFTPPALRAELFPKVEDFLFRHLQAAPSGSDLQLLWFRRFLGAVASKKSQDYVQKLLIGKAHLAGMTMDTERRWDLITALAQSGSGDAPELIKTELAKDSSDLGAKRAIAAEASMPDPTTKAKWLERIFSYPFAKHSTAAQDSAKESAKAAVNDVTPPASDTETIPIGKLREAMRSYQEIGQETYTQAMADSFFEKLPSLVKSSDEVYAGNLSGNLFPSLCDPAMVTKTETLLKMHPELPTEVIRNLRINAQEEQRCIRARALSGGDQKQS